MNDDASAPADDRDLRQAMTDYQRGSMEAFERLYAALLDPLRRYLLGLSRDRSLAQDLLQETFLQIHRSRHTYRPEHSVQPWAFGVAHHVFLMHRRSAARRARRESERAGAESWKVGLEAPERAVIDRQLVQRALRSISPERRQVVVMHHLFGFRFEEIGRRLGIRADAAKVRASRGVAALRSLLSKQEPPE